MTVATTLNLIGGIVETTPGSFNTNITLPNPVEDYVILAQPSNPTVCWFSGASGNVATVTLNAPALTGETISYLAIPITTDGLTNLVLPPGTSSVTVENIPLSINVIPIAAWNTQVWQVREGNTITFFFNAPPGVNSNFSYLEVAPALTIIEVADQIGPGVSNATLSYPGANFLPVALLNWNTAVGTVINSNNVNLEFSNPSNAANVVVLISIPLNKKLLPAPQTPLTPVQQPWIVPILSPEDYAARFISMFPYPWIGDGARVAGGIAYTLFIAYGTNLNYIIQQLYYAWEANRLATCIDTQLDLFSQDYFGNQLPRLAGESDSSYRQRIGALLLQPRVTKQAIINAIEFFDPGVTVRAIEPWNPSETSYYGTTSPHIGSYYDYDSEAVPGLWGAPGRRYQGFLQIQLPPINELAFSLYGYDFGAAYTSITGWYFQPIQELQTQVGQIINLIQQIIAEGTEIWAQFNNNVTVPFTVGGSFAIASGLYTININTPAAIGFYGLFLQISQPINVWQTGSAPGSFKATTSAPVPSGTFMNYVAIENGAPGLHLASVDAGSLNYGINADANHNVVLIQPQWNTNFFYTGRSVGAINFQFSTPTPVGSLLNYLVYPTSTNAGYHNISGNTTTATISLTVNAINIPLVIPNWDTTVGCKADPINGQIHLTFNTPAPAGGGEVMFISYPVA